MGMPLPQETRGVLHDEFKNMYIDAVLIGDRVRSLGDVFFVVVGGCVWGGGGPLGGRAPRRCRGPDGIARGQGPQALSGRVPSTPGAARVPVFTGLRPPQTKTPDNKTKNAPRTFHEGASTVLATTVLVAVGGTAWIVGLRGRSLRDVFLLCAFVVWGWEWVRAILGPGAGSPRRRRGPY
jgi:hypothetical protein